MVTTAEELLQAVEDDSPHIEIQAHLDLTTLELRDEFRILGEFPSNIYGNKTGALQVVHSIRVRCSAIMHASISDAGPVLAPSRIRLWYLSTLQVEVLTNFYTAQNASNSPFESFCM